jgi:hypothetical protein
MAALGTRAPDFALPDGDGVDHAPGGPATVVYFTSNRCPHARRWQARLGRAARDYAAAGVRFLAINVPAQFPAAPEMRARMPLDDLAALRAAAATPEWEGVAYLFDESLEVARAFDAKTTPDVYVLDAQLVVRYRGAPDGEWDVEAAQAGWLRDALDAVLAGREVPRPQTNSVGCPIKWRRPAAPLVAAADDAAPPLDG